MIRAQSEGRRGSAPIAGSLQPVDPSQALAEPDDAREAVDDTSPSSVISATSRRQLLVPRSSAARRLPGASPAAVWSIRVSATSLSMAGVGQRCRFVDGGWIVMNRTVARKHQARADRPSGPCLDGRRLIPLACVDAAGQAPAPGASADDGARRGAEGAVQSPGGGRRTYWWCACGRSARQPFCDGSHQGTGLAPVKHKAERTARSSSAAASRREARPCATAATRPSEAPPWAGRPRRAGAPGPARRLRLEGPAAALPAAGHRRSHCPPTPNTSPVPPRMPPPSASARRLSASAAAAATRGATST